MKKNSWLFFLAVPLILSGFTHLWNPIGFPDIFYDEGIYMRRTIHVLDGLGVQERSFYDHPYFGQLFLAGSLSLIGYPDSINPAADVHSIEMFYLIPRVLIGILAVADTFLIYKIAELAHNRNVAFFGAVLFAVMPITWLMRRILLDSILLPFLLLSILLAIYSKDSKNKQIMIFLSGICLGLVIFTKIPMFAMIPLVGFLVYKNTKNLKTIGLWFIPVILIPLIWPAQSIASENFDLWIKDMLWQTGRENGGFTKAVWYFSMFDPVLLILGVAGVVFAAIKKDWMILLWVIPFLIFMSIIGYVQYFHWIPLLPAFCIALSRFVLGINEVSKKKISQIFYFIIISGIAVFGLVSTTLLITTNVSSQYEAAAFVVQYVQNNNNEEIRVISSPVYSWIFNYIYHQPKVYADYRDLFFCPIQNEKVLLIYDDHFKSNIGSGEQLQFVYDNTEPIKSFESGVLDYDHAKYPFGNLYVNHEGSQIEIRVSNSEIQTSVANTASSMCLDSFR